MTILDSFYVLFGTKKVAQTRTEIAGIDKQLDDMDRKGKKRSEVEDKRYQELKKQRKELIESLQIQRRETEKLSDSFKDLTTNAVGALTAWATFSGIKNALIDVNKLNSSLQVLSGQTGISGREY